MVILTCSSRWEPSPDPRTCRDNPLPSPRGSRNEEADLLPAPEAPALLSPLYFGLQKERQSHGGGCVCMKTFPASTSLLIPICKCDISSPPWCLCWSPVYRRTESLFQKMKEGSVIPGLMALEGKRTKPQPAEHSLSVGVSLLAWLVKQAATRFVETRMTHCSHLAEHLRWII